MTLLNNVAKIRTFFECYKDYSGIFLLYSKESKGGKSETAIQDLKLAEYD